MMSRLPLTIAALFLGAVPISSHAATILFDFSGGDIAFGANLGVGSAVTTNDFSGSGVTVSNWTAASPSREIGIAGGQVRAKKSGDIDTHQFTITIPDSVTIELTSISFDYGNFGPDTSPANFLVSSDVNGEGYTNNPATHDPGTFSGNVVMGLSGFTGLTDRTITFIFEDSADGNNSSESMYTFIDNVTLTGTVIPEPSAALLGCFGSLLLLRRRR